MEEEVNKREIDRIDSKNIDEEPVDLSTTILKKRKRKASDQSTTSEVMKKREDRNILKSKHSKNRANTLSKWNSFDMHQDQPELDEKQKEDEDYVAPGCSANPSSQG